MRLRMAFALRNHCRNFRGHAGITGGTGLGHAEHCTGNRALGPLLFGQLITGRGHVQFIQVGTAKRGGRDLKGGQLDGRQLIAGIGIDFQDLRRGKRNKPHVGLHRFSRGWKMLRNSARVSYTYIILTRLLLKQATHRFSSVSIVMPSGSPTTLELKEKITDPLAERRYRGDREKKTFTTSCWCSLAANDSR